MIFEVLFKLFCDDEAKLILCQVLIPGEALTTSLLPWQREAPAAHTHDRIPHCGRTVGQGCAREMPPTRGTELSWSNREPELTFPRTKLSPKQTQMEEDTHIPQLLPHILPFPPRFPHMDQNLLAQRICSHSQHPAQGRVTTAVT